MKRKLAMIFMVPIAAMVVLAGCNSNVTGQATSARDVKDHSAPNYPPAPSASASTVTHHVTYTLTAQDEAQVTILYLANEPPSHSAFDRSPPDYLSLATRTIGPDNPWTIDVTLDDPEDWSFVQANINGEKKANLHCEVSIDGVETFTDIHDNVVKCPARGW